MIVANASNFKMKWAHQIKQCYVIQTCVMLVVVLVSTHGRTHKSSTICWININNQI